MKTKEINVNVIHSLNGLKSSDGNVPSPYFIPTKILISDDEILGMKNIIFIYFNKEPDETKSINGIKVFLGKISGKIQRIETNSDLKTTFKKIKDENFALGYIIHHIYENYILADAELVDI